MKRTYMIVALLTLAVAAKAQTLFVTGDKEMQFRIHVEIPKVKLSKGEAFFIYREGQIPKRMVPSNNYERRKGMFLLDDTNVDLINSIAADGKWECNLKINGQFYLFEVREIVPGPYQTAYMNGDPFTFLL